MFTIRLDLIVETLRGIRALDKRRELGLPDDTVLYIVDSKVIAAEVPESFARQYFPPDAECVKQRVPLDLLRKGDLEEGVSHGLAVWRNAPDRDLRIIDLWLAAKAVVAAADAAVTPEENDEQDDDD